MRPFASLWRRLMEEAAVGGLPKPRELGLDLGRPDVEMGLDPPTVWLSKLDEGAGARESKTWREVVLPGPAALGKRGEQVQSMKVGGLELGAKLVIGRGAIG